MAISTPNGLINLRKIVHAYDHVDFQEAIDSVVKTLCTEATLGSIPIVPETFLRPILNYEGKAPKVMMSRCVFDPDNVKYEEALDSPFAVACDPKHLFLSHEVQTQCRGVTIKASVTAYVPLPPEVTNTLRAMGKVKTSVTEATTSDYIDCSV